MDPANTVTRAGRQRVAGRYLGFVDTAVAAGYLAQALDLLARAEQVAPDSALVVARRERSAAGS